MDTEARFGKKGKSLHYFGEVVWGVFLSGLGWRVGGGVWEDDERKVERVGMEEGRGRERVKERG